MNYFGLALTFIWTIQVVYTQVTFTVSKDGNGNFTTISQAISAAPNHSQQRTYIKIKAGIYHEYITITKEKQNLHLVGDGMENTTISGNRSTNMGISTYQTTTVGIHANGFLATEITFENTAGINMATQAVAVTNTGNYTAFYRCRFLGHQDTLYTKYGIQFYRDCEVYGTVDFIFGDARALLQNCNIYARKPIAGQSNTITAQGKETSNEISGIVMQNCTITGAPDLKPEMMVKTFLGRPWKNYSTTVVMQSFLDKVIDPRGWLEWEGRDLNKVYYAEYQNKGPGARTDNRVKWARVNINSKDAAKFTARNFIEGKKWIASTKMPYYLDLL